MCKFANRAPATPLDYIEWVAANSLWPDNIPYEVCCFIGCQFALESNFGNSALARKNNNHCGMKRPKIRPTYNVEHSGVWAAYPILDDCIFDYFLWLVYNRITMRDLDSLDHFTKWLRNSKYCPEPDYVDRIMSIYNKYCLNLFKSF